MFKLVVLSLAVALAAAEPGVLGPVWGGHLAAPWGAGIAAPLAPVGIAAPIGLGGINHGLLGGHLLKKRSIVGAPLVAGPVGWPGVARVVAPAPIVAAAPVAGLGWGHGLRWGW